MKEKNAVEMARESRVNRCHAKKIIAVEPWTGNRFLVAAETLGTV